MAFTLKNLADELKKKFQNFTQNTIPQGLAQVASNPQLNRAAQNINQIPQQVGSGIVNTAQFATKAPIISDIGYKFPRQYAQGQIAQPIYQGAQQIRQPGLLNKGLGALQIGMGAFNANPLTAGFSVPFNLGVGAVGGGLEALRTKKPIAQNVYKGITEPTSIASQGLGVKNPALALGLDIALMNPKSALKGLKNPKEIISAIKGLSPNSFKIHLEDQKIMKDFIYQIEKGNAKKELGQLGIDAARVAEHYVGKNTATWSNKKLAQVFDAILSRNAIKAGEDVLQTKFPRMGFAEEAKSAQGGLYDTKKYPKATIGFARTPTTIMADEAIYIRPSGEMLSGAKGAHGEVAARILGEDVIRKAGKTSDKQIAKFMSEFGEARISTTPSQVNISFVNELSPQQLQVVRKISGEGRVIFFDKVDSSGKILKSGQAKTFNEFIKNVAQQPLSAQPKGVGGVKIKAPEAKLPEKIKVAQEEALQESIKPTVKVKEVAPTKATVVSGVGEVSPKTPGGIQGPSAKSLTQDKYSFNVNMNRLDLTPVEKQTLKTTIETIKPELQSVKGSKLSNSEVLKEAKKSDMLTQITTREETKQAEAALLKARQNVTSLDKEITSLLKGGKIKQVEGKMRSLIESLRVVSSNAADAGRKLQSLSIEAGDESVRASILKDISKTNAKTEDILREANKVDWDSAKSITAFYRKFIKPSKTEILDEFRYNNMLSNPRTHLRNAFSNLIQTYITRPATLLAQGKVGETAKYYKGSIKALPDAFGAFSDAFSGKTAVAKPDIAHISTGKLPKLLTVPTRAMEAADRFFSKLIQGGELARGATAEEAAKTAEYSLFRQGLRPEGQGTVLNAIDNATEGVYQLGKKIPLVRWFVPFIRTPMNFAKQWIEYSPTGLSTIPGAANKGEQIAKTMVGSIVTLMGAKLALDGNTTWAAPTDPKQKELFYASGRKPYSIKLGKNWVSMMYSGPFAYALALPAAVEYYNKENRTALTDSQMDKLGKITSSMAEFLSGQTFMEGLGNFVSLLRGDSDYSVGKNLGYTAGQFIPLQALVRWASTIVDPVYRKSKTAQEQIISGIPFASKSLEPYTDPMGEPSTRERLNLVTPYDITPEKRAYEPMYQQRTVKLQSNALENKAVKDLEASKQGTQVVNDKFMYWDEESSSVKKISLDFDVEEPKLVGVKEVDARLISGYKTKLTNKENDIIKLWEQGVLTQEEAISYISAMEDLKTAASNKVKKPKKITIKTTKFKAPTITVRKKAKTQIPMIKITKPPKLQKISRRYTISP